MISGVFGLPGAGKTTFLTWCALRALNNQPLFVGHLFRKVYLTEFDNYDAVFTTFPLAGCFKFDYENTAGIFRYKRALILVDEMSMIQDNRDFKNYNANKKYFWAYMRHSESDCIYCSQSYLDCDKKIQNMTSALFLIEKRPRDRSRVSPVLPEQLIQKHDITVGYTLAPPMSRTTINRRKLYSCFDSFDYADLPLVPLIPWSAPAVVQSAEIQAADLACSIVQDDEMPALDAPRNETVSRLSSRLRLVK